MLGWFRAEAACASRSKAAECLRVFGYIFGQKLEGDEAAKLRVLSLVDDTHPAAAEFLDDAVVRNGLADHWAEILGPGRGQVNEGVEVACVIKGQLVKNPDYTHWTGSGSWQLVGGLRETPLAASREPQWL